MNKTAPGPKKANERPLRVCRYCRARFKPDRDNQRFCSATHRKKYWQYGALPFDKLLARIDRTLDRRINATMDPRINGLIEMIRSSFQATELAIADLRRQVNECRVR